MLGFAWIGERPGRVLIQWHWLGSEIEFSLQVFLVFLFGFLTSGIFLWILFSFIFGLPNRYRSWQSRRNVEYGYRSLSRGLIALNSGELDLSHRLVRESRRLLPKEPLVYLLEAQSSLARGEIESAKRIYRRMLDDPAMRLMGLHELYRQAMREGDMESIHLLSHEAYELSPRVEWVSRSALHSSVMKSDWEVSLSILERGRTHGIYAKHDYSRKKAVLLTALAQQQEDSDFVRSMNYASQAHKLADDLVPAALLLSRLHVRRGNSRKASSVLLSCWHCSPHPDLAHSYIDIASSASERLERAESLCSRSENHDSLLALGRAALDAGEFTKSRDALDKALSVRASERVCLLMADLEESEHGNLGRVQHWLSRAVSAPSDYAWISGSYVSSRWLPSSPLTHELDSFEWRLPPEVLSSDGSVVEMDISSESLSADSESTPMDFARSASSFSRPSRLLTQTDTASPIPDDPGPGDSSDTTDSVREKTTRRKNSFF